MRKAGVLPVLGVAALAWGCRPVAIPEAPSPTPVPEPGAPEAAARPAQDEPEDWLVPPSLPGDSAGRTDPILGSPAARDTAFQRQVEEWTRRWTTESADWFSLYLERMGAWENLVDGALEVEGLPFSLRYLPIVESGYSPRAVSGAAAVGMWQFMTPTARSLGLRVGPLVDERRDPVASTMAAARYLDELHDRFGSWFLALAGYNGGPSRVDRLARRHAPLQRPSDEIYFTIQPHLPRETAEFVAKFFAAVRVARDAEQYGLAPDTVASPAVWDEVTVPDATSLDVVAEAAGVSEDDVAALNPHILRKVTPRGRATGLRLPEGTGARFAAAYSRIPLDQRVTVEEHVVARGETMWDIARLYGVPLAELQAANPDVSARRMRPGHRLMVPSTPGGTGSSGSVMAARNRVHVVESGDTLWELARQYDVRVDDLLRWNGLGSRAVLQPGQRLRIGGA